MNPNELEEYLNNMIKPALEEYAKKHNTTIEELLLEIISLEDTKLFNYKSHQSTVYNRLRNNNITNLKELFTSHNNNIINYGKNELKSNHDYYIHNEIEGIISLLKYKYLNIIPIKLKELLNYKINTNHNIIINPYHQKYNHPGNILYSVYENPLINKSTLNAIDKFYMILKSCGFNQVGVKALIDIAYQEKINDITLGEFLSNLSIDKIEDKFSNIKPELKPFLNILNIILDYYNNHCKSINSKNHQK